VSGKVVAIRPDCVPYQSVLENVNALKDTEEILVITKTDRGTYTLWASGNLSYLAEAALFLQRYATSFVMEKVEDDDE